MEVTCERCGRDYDSSDVELILPWENGNNPYAFWICPHCRSHNRVYGFGEDDD